MFLMFYSIFVLPPHKPNMTGWKIHHLKMYFLLKMAIFQPGVYGKSGWTRVIWPTKTFLFLALHFALQVWCSTASLKKKSEDQTKSLKKHKDFKIMFWSCTVCNICTNISCQLIPASILSINPPAKKKKKNKTCRIWLPLKTSTEPTCMQVLNPRKEEGRLDGVPEMDVQSEIPRHSMYGTFTYIYHKSPPNVRKYTIHGWYRIE